MGLFSFLATPLGFVLRWIYELLPDYFAALFVFTLLVRLLMFPLNIKSQKNAADRARLAPRLERIQKKYANDRQKLAEKQQALYEKEGVSLTGGCLPMIVQMLVLFSVIAVIYKPLVYIKQMPDADITTCTTAVVEAMKEDGTWDDDKKNETNFSEKSYYREMNLMEKVDKYEDKIRAALVKSGKSEADAEATMDLLKETKEQFSIFGVSLLQQPSYSGILPNWLWIIAILSGITALFTSLLSMHYNKASQPQQQEQMGGCSPNMMMYMMPVMSLIISFGVPAGVAVYWIFSNLLALVQTVVLNAMYNPAKIRAQAEAEYAERRRKKQEDKERLKAARLAEQAAWQKEENEKRAQKAGKKPASKKTVTEDAPQEIPAADEKVEE